MSMGRFPTNPACRRAETWISRDLDADLEEPERRRLGEHLDGCADCRSHRELLLQARTVMRDKTVEPSENFEWKVQLGIQRALREGAARAHEPRSSFWRPAMASAAVVAVAVIGIGAATLVGNGGSTEAFQAPPSARLAAESPAGPDLSRAVPSEPIRVEVRGDTGVRRVSGALDAPRFRGDLYAPVRDAARGPAATMPVGNPTRGGQVFGNAWWSPVGSSSNAQELNLRIEGRTLQRLEVPATDSTAHTPR